MVGDGENEGRPESRSRRNVGAIPGAVYRIGGDLVGRIDSTKVLGRGRSRWRPCMARRGGSRRRCRPWKNGGAWGRKEGRSIPPKWMPGVDVSRFALRWSRADGNGESEGEGNEPIQTDTRY